MDSVGLETNEIKQQSHQSQVLFRYWIQEEFGLMELFHAYIFFS
jgi:hypothetical protein